MSAAYDAANRTIICILHTVIAPPGVYIVYIAHNVELYLSCGT